MKERQIEKKNSIYNKNSLREKIMKKHYYWIALLLFSLNLQASDVNKEEPKSNTQKRIEHLLTLCGACGIGCVSGSLCARFMGPVNSGEELSLLTIIIWGLCEAKLMDHVCDDLKSLDIAHHEGLMRYTVWASSWVSWVYSVNQIARK